MLLGKRWNAIDRMDVIYSDYARWLFPKALTRTLSSG
jgi:hypothetical protein